MAYDGTLQDFDKESDAQTLYQSKVEKAKKDSIKKDEDGRDIIPSCNIHKCYHDKMPFKPCELIEKYKLEARRVESY